MPTASVIMTAKDEPRSRLRRVLRSLAEQEGLADGLEVLVARDPTDLVTRVDAEPAGAIRRVTLIENPGGARSTGLNLAARAASTPWVCRVDARSLLSPHHVARCIEMLKVRPEVGVVGGVQRPVVVSTGLQARGIVRALSNPWALGGASYRTGRRSGAVDTVYLGAFRREELVGLGGYDEALAANEDFELCRRYREAGFVVWLDATLDVGYEPRDTLTAVWEQYLAFGRSKMRYWRTTGERPNKRQLIALTIAGAAVGGAGMAAIRRPKLLAGLGAGATAGLAVLDAVGGEQPVDIPTRAAAIPVYVTIFTAWIGGIALEAALTVLARTSALPFRARSAGSAP